MNEFLTSPDFLMACGTVIGITYKSMALMDERTSWSRKSSGLNIFTYPITALYPMWKLDLWLTFSASLISMALWTGIFIFRSPEDEDLKKEFKKLFSHRYLRFEPDHVSR